MERCWHGSIWKGLILLMQKHHHVQIGRTINEDLPALPESQSAVAVCVARATVARVARENLMMKCSAGEMRQCLCDE
jgi:hypothetical protein